jgi:RNA polymerase sigma factor (sigma-70 family)
MVWDVCCRILRCHQDAEDAFQATFLVLVRKAASIAAKESVANWLYGVARQTALKARAMAAKRGDKEKQVAELPEPAAVEHTRRCDLRSVLDDELSHLPEIYRAVIVLCDLEGRTRKESARQLGCPEGTVAGRLARARAMLAKRLARHGLAVATVLSHRETSAALPANVVSSTIKAARLFAVGTVAGVPTQVIDLTEGVVKNMTLSRFKKAAVALLLICVMGGAGVMISRTAGGEQRAPASDKADVKAKPQWEYKALSYDDIKALEFQKRGTDSLEDGLNSLGRDGWDLVAIEPPVPGALPNLLARPALYVFKRPKK